MARRTNKPDNPNKNELFCSFCGKSQFEVAKLIAGPTVFICSECTELCQDIVYTDENLQGVKTKDGKTRYSFGIEFDSSFTPAEQSLIPALVKGIELAYPSCSVSIKAVRIGAEESVLYLDFNSPIELKGKQFQDLKDEVENLSRKLKIAEAKLLAEKSERERFENLYKELVYKIFPVLIDKLNKDGELTSIQLKPLLIVFADIVGFSTLSSEDQIHQVDLMRLIAKSVLKSDKEVHLNTWGDGIVATFVDVTQGVRCACRFVRHLDVDGIDVRVGINWGPVRLKHNEATNRMDVDGDSVNLGARLESLAETGEVLMSDIIVGLPEFVSTDFQITKKEVPLKKAVGELAAGQNLTAYSVRLNPNK